MILLHDHQIGHHHDGLEPIRLQEYDNTYIYLKYSCLWSECTYHELHLIRNEDKSK